METLETKWRCAGLDTGLSAAEKQGARSKLTGWELEWDRYKKIPDMSIMVVPTEESLYS